MTSDRIPFIDLRPGDDDAAVRAAIDRVIARGWFVLGPEVEAFEAEFASASSAAHAVGVGTGTDAIALMLRAMNVNRGDEVIVPALTAAYTALAVLLAGATPVFADIDPERLTLDPDACEAAVTSRTVAIVPVHLYGQPADMRALQSIAQRRSLAMIEDCCQAHLATCDDIPVGTRGAGGAFSFYPTKNLGALGDGGAILTNDASLAERLRRLRNGGQIDRYIHSRRATTAGSTICRQPSCACAFHSCPAGRAGGVLLPPRIGEPCPTTCVRCASTTPGTCTICSSCGRRTAMRSRRTCAPRASTR